MKNKRLNFYYIFCIIGVFIASFYPLLMGIRVITDMIIDGVVAKENYPKYIIPYTPISIAIILGVILMPLCFKLFKKLALLLGALISTGAFFCFELLFEQKILVSANETITELKNWQMVSCFFSPEMWEESIAQKSQTAIQILIGDYNPAFKLHFYIISVVLIITVLNCIYGFYQIIKAGEKKRQKALILQSVCTAVFLGLCILACFTAFWRDGSIEVSPISAILMAVYFILLGVTVGVFVGSLLLGKRKLLSLVIPSVCATVMTLLMYIGEMILLNWHLYSFGKGFFFQSIKGIILAPVDILIVLASGCITALIFKLLNHKKQNKD